MSINFVPKTFSFHKHFGTVLTEGIRTAKFCTKVSVMQKHLKCPNIIYLNGVRTCLDSVRSFYVNNMAVLLRYGKIFFLHLHLERGVVHNVQCVDANTIPTIFRGGMHDSVMSSLHLCMHVCGECWRVFD